MKPFTVSTTSRWFTRPWHIQLATTYGTLRDSEAARQDLLEDGTDICSYTKAIFWGALFTLVMTAVVGFLFGAIVGDFGAWIAAGIMHGFVQPDEGAMFLLMLAIVATAVVGIIMFCIMIGKVKQGRTLTPSFVGQAYDSWKNKYCVELKFASGWKLKVPE
jgi:hypothetical protein